jgi:hypothetical protein
MATGKNPDRKAGRGDGRPKFHGTVTHTPPGSGATIQDGDHIVVSILELSFGDVPDPTRLNELLFTLKLSTKDPKGKWTADSRTSGEFLYVQDGSSLNVHDWVIFDGPVQRHLSLEVEITELESPKKGEKKQTKELTDMVGLFAESVGNLSIPALDPVGAALEIAAAAYGAARVLNGHDQVLKYFTSLYTASLSGGGAPALVEGVHVIEKKGRPRGKKKDPPSFVTMKLCVRKAPKSKS